MERQPKSNEAQLLITAIAGVFVLAGISTFAFTLMATEFKTVEWLKDWRAIVMITSPVQALASIFWIQSVISINQNVSYNMAVTSIRRRLLVATPTIGLLATGAVLFSPFFFDLTSQTDINIWIFAFAVPIINASFYISNILIRSLGHYKFLFVCSSFNSLLLPGLVFVQQDSLNLSSVFQAQLFGVISIHAAFLLLARIKTEWKYS